MFEALYQAIQISNPIILHRHSRPDGDALGSQIGLKHLLKENFPEKQIFVVGDDAGFYDFMEDCAMDQIPDSTYANALAIVLDCGAAHLISDDRWKLAPRTARIDHHL